MIFQRNVPDCFYAFMHAFVTCKDELCAYWICHTAVKTKSRLWAAQNKQTGTTHAAWRCLEQTSVYKVQRPSLLSSMWCIGRLTVTPWQERGEYSLRIRKRKWAHREWIIHLVCADTQWSQPLYTKVKMCGDSNQRWRSSCGFRPCGPEKTEKEKVWGEMVRTRRVNNLYEFSDTQQATFLHRRSMESLDIIFYLSLASGRCPACPFRLVLSSACKYKCFVWKWPHIDRPLLSLFFFLDRTSS